MLSRNKILLAVLALAVVAAFAFSAFGQGKPAGKVPVFVVDKKTVNLGDQIEGQDIDYTFVLKNKGDGELQVLSVRPG
jgi:hypothetical protein